MRHILGDTNEIKEGNTKAYTLTFNQKSLSLFVANHFGKFYAYENQCPHTGINLDWQPDQFLDITEKYIQCSTHGALFRIDNGLCEWGPCLGKHLKSISILVEDGKLVVVHHDV